METIELELQQIASANLYHLIPSYLFDYFKDELNDRILVNLINDLDSLIQTIETNNSFKILSLNENTDNENDNRDRVANSNEQPPSSSLNSEVVLLNSCKSLLSDISIRLNEIFTKYSSEINLKLSFICDNLKEKANEEIKIMKWKYAATCFDKLFFYMVSIGFLVAFVSTILSNPKFYNN